MKVITVISQKGGVGKTTTAVHLAVEAECRGYATVIFDLDPQASASTWGDTRREFSEFPAVQAVQASRLEKMIEAAAAQKADLVIIDSAPNADSASLMAAEKADLIIVPCRPAAFDLNAIGTTLKAAKLANKPAWVLLNAVASQGRIGEEAATALKSQGVQVIGVMLHHLVAFSYSVNDGKTASEYDPKGRAAKETIQLFDWVEKQTNLKSNISTRKRA